MATPFRLYNTTTRTTEDFRPLTPGEVKLYVCGMTVYDHAHVGHARAMVVFDAFVRLLRHQGWSVNFVRNFTDVDDKIIRRANAENVEPMEIANRYIQSFHEDCAGLGLLPPDAEPRVSESIGDILDMVKNLVDDGHAYASEGSVWFHVPSFPDYGCLSGQQVDELRNASESDPAKRHPADFALWKAAKPGEPAWESPWGQGRPGWHIECSAMVKKQMGSTIDIHGGGLDLVFPHHENEIAQSTCANQEKYVNYWMHNGLLVLQKRGEDGNQNAAKMGKSLGNAFNIRDALTQFPAEALRLYYLQAHYRSPLPWHDQALSESLAMLARLYEAREVAESMSGEESAETVAKDLGPDAQALLDLSRSFDERFFGALREDFNTARALSHAFELARAINRFANHKKARKRGGPIASLALQAMANLNVLGLMTQSSSDFQAEVKDKRLAAMGLSAEQIEDLLAQRKAARANKDWGRADDIRDELDKLGVVVMDGASGVSWKIQLIRD